MSNDIVEMEKFRESNNFSLYKLDFSMCISCGRKYNNSTNGVLRLKNKIERHASQIHKIGS